MQLQTLLALVCTIVILFIAVNESAPTTAKASTTVKTVTIVTEAPVLVVNK